MKNKMHKLIIPLIFLNLSLLFCVNVAAKESSEIKYLTSTVKFKNISQKNIKLYISFPDIFRDQSFTKEDLIKLTTNSAIETEKILNTPFKDNLNVYFNYKFRNHNGSSQVVPDNRIFINLMPPTNDLSIGYSSNYLKSTLVHEFAHMISTQHRRKFFRLFSWLFGNVSRPNALWPMWIHEGLAVWAEQYSAYFHKSKPQQLDGRPANGAIDFDLRKYAEYYQRTKKLPFKSHQLSGNLSYKHNHSKISKGNIPYHFGYLIFEEFFNLEKNSINDFISDGAKKFGFFYQDLFKTKSTKNLDTIWTKLTSKWKNWPLNNQSKNKSLITKQENLRSLSKYKDNVFWIEINDGKTFLVKLHNKKIQKIRWNYSRAVLLKVLANKNNFVALVKKNPHYLKNNFKNYNNIPINTLWITNNKLQKHCSIKTPNHIIDFTISNNTIGWIEVSSDLYFSAYKAKLNPNNCQITNKTLLSKSETMLERINNISFAANKWAVIKSNKLNSFEDKILVNGKIINYSNILSSPITVNSKSCSTCLIAIETTKKHKQPIILNIQDPSKPLKVGELSLKTGASEFAITKKGIYVIEKLWDKDIIAYYPYSSFSPAKSAIEKQPNHINIQKKLDHINQLENTNISSTKKFNPIKSLWPHFWIPYVLASNGEFSISGNVFGNDLSKRYFYNLNLGYDSFTNYPWGQFLISRSLNTILFDKIYLAAFYSPEVNFFNSNQIDENSSVSISLSGNINLFYHSILGYKFGYSFENRSFPTGEEVFHTPFSSLTLKTPHGTFPQTGRLVNQKKPGLLLSHNFSFLNGYNQSNTMNFRTPIFSSGLEFTTQYGEINDNLIRSSNPHNYFLLGGLYTINTSKPGVITRGYPPRLVAAKSYLRVSTDLVFNLGNLNINQKWNQWNFSNVDLHFIAESLTFKTISNSFSLFDEYLTSFGLELDIHNQFINYVNTKLSFGVFSGINENLNGETKFNFTFQSDLPF